MRLATADDNARLCSLFREVDMSAALCLAEERDPDFFALQRAQGGQSYTCLLEPAEGGEAFGCASIMARDAWIDGNVQRIGYASDLRIESAHRNGRIFPEVIEHFMKFMQRREGIDLMYSAVLSSNQRGRNALLNRGAQRQGQPMAQVMTPYHMTSIQFTGKVAAPTVAVEQATQEHLPELVALLAAEQKKRLFGEVVTQEWLQKRFNDWPDFSIENFYFVRNAQGKMVACTALWDSSPHVRRERVLQYNGMMKVARKVFNLDARFRGFAPLPDEGHCFNFVYLTHTEVEDDNPVWLNALLRGLYQRLQDQKLHFMSLMIPEGSALSAAVKEFRVQTVAMELIAFTNEQSRWHGKSLRTQHPGFEMALH
ncbi:MAG: hypothetical protein H6999_03855 [Hahellaceae bacterium]|nr:hypothetical protein [Hahellaceae bacterium]MCP5168873.1 hypothetical protein [Hahellaceae bacterium]